MATNITGANNTDPSTGLQLDEQATRSVKQRGKLIAGIVGLNQALASAQFDRAEFQLGRLCRLLDAYVHAPQAPARQAKGARAAHDDFDRLGTSTTFADHFKERFGRGPLEVVELQPALEYLALTLADRFQVEDNLRYAGRAA